MTTSDPAVQPPFCEVHGCRGRWAADLPHTLCGMGARKVVPMTDGVPFVNVTKISHMVPISREMAMDYGLIPDDRPAPPPPSRRQRFRWWRQERVRRARMKAASWVAGFDVEDSW